MQQIKHRIAEVYARRERLKQALAAGELAARAGFAQLETTDRELSELDSRYKTLWDAANPRRAGHPAAAWARRTVFAPAQLDCVAAIMLKVLDGKCKMGPADKAAITAVYDVVKGQAGESLADEVHDLIAAARQGMDADLAATVHGWRTRAEALIAKPVMKDFKAFIGAAMPRTEETT
ncbi:hypothetical protein EZJ19_02795 [Parasulfuritortus cantonensis]|uniref:Uncharacterized protein n=1 Tax=Parasulfuritortus cantonensis TaxID=2528202 RepID=A0A4R1BL79_9PROT|nr:hypothetical protein [Parasulfuritortus cantonensis]TCJ18181.1 hypothetical protein EZJ19_02795 [Parasulfuritortus cantonensis]